MPVSLFILHVWEGLNLLYINDSGEKKNGYIVTKTVLAWRRARDLNPQTALTVYAISGYVPHCSVIRFVTKLSCTCHAVINLADYNAHDEARGRVSDGGTARTIG